MSVNQNHKGVSAEKTEVEAWVDIVRKQLSDLKFGVIQIVVHEGRVVQIEKTEKVRLDKQRTE